MFNKPLYIQDKLHACYVINLLLHAYKDHSINCTTGEMSEA